MRGEQVIFKNISEIDSIPKQVKKGRNRELLNERNRALINRYYYYKSSSTLRYEAILSKLRCEFYLSQVTIVEIITANVDELVSIQKIKPSISTLKKDFQHFNWG